MNYYLLYFINYLFFALAQFLQIVCCYQFLGFDNVVTLKFKKMKKILLTVAVSATILASCGKSEKQIELEKQQALTAQRDSLKLDSFKRADALAAEKKVEEEKRAVEAKHTAELAAARRSVNRSYSSGGTVTTSSAGVTTTQAKKKGWSDAAKGTAIGAGVGAVTGVLIDKKDGRGAIIGGLTGAGAGYVIGRAEDRKSGRVQKN